MKKILHAVVDAAVAVVVDPLDSLGFYLILSI